MTVSDDDLHPFERLGGKSALRLSAYSQFLLVAGGALGLPLAFESKVGSFEPYYISIFLTLALLNVLLGACMSWWAVRKRQLEIDHGYTSWLPMAISDPNLYLVNSTTLDVISRPGEPRPGAAPPATRE